MRERPILFSAPMVRAIFEGKKTQTRRVVKPQPNSGPNGEMVDLGGAFGLADGVLSGEWKSPFGVPGDTLWVRETWKENTPPSGFIYRADDLSGHVDGPWKPSIFMPRVASRITLEITGVRVERLQEISADDAIAEGAIDWAMKLPTREERNAAMDGSTRNIGYVINAYAELWNSINEKRGYGWDVNPWVWVIEFERLEVPA